MYVYFFNFIRSSEEFRDRKSGNFSILISDVAEDINEITWNLAVKISRIEKSYGTILSYFYDAMGNRIGKTFTWKYQTTYPWYLLDADGNAYCLENGLNAPQPKLNTLYGVTPKLAALNIDLENLF